MQKKPCVCLVEDYISAIRVSKFVPTAPLFGCTINLEMLTRLSKLFTKVLVWLDADKLDNARKIALNANMVGLESSVIYAYKDPKNHSDKELEEILNGTTKV